MSHSSAYRTLPRAETTIRTIAVADCVAGIVDRAGPAIVLGLPLGIGKPHQVSNALFAKVAGDSDIELEIFTALTLERPHASSDLEARFLGPLAARLFDACADLDFESARRRGALPANVRISEFFMRPGTMLGNADAQQHYVSSNYTHAARDLLDRGVNVIAQQVAPHPTDPDRVSLSTNPDVLLDLLEMSDPDRRRQLVLVGEINPAMPFMPNDAEVDVRLFDYVLDRESSAYASADMGADPIAATPAAAGGTALFPAPKIACALTDFAIAAHVASLVKDGGTLQIGIGSLGDAITHLLRLRHQDNGVFNGLIEDLIPQAVQQLRSRLPVEADVFDAGLYAASEMATEGFFHLRRAGVLKRRVYDDAVLQTLVNEDAIGSRPSSATLRLLHERGRIESPLQAADVAFLKRFGIFDRNVEFVPGGVATAGGETLSTQLDDPEALAALCEQVLGAELEGGIYLHGGFFLGSQWLYAELAQLSDAERAGINMTGIRFINALYGDQRLKTLQRRDARFVNSAMMATAVGAVVSDAVAGNRVVSGVGGQYDFVAQAHALLGARSLICLPSTRVSAGRVASNIVWQYPHTTVPRHLRDMIVTEYGAADLRGRTDAECIAAMLAITDSRFQSGLLDEAKRARKIAADYVIPEAFTRNLPERVADAFEAQDRLRWFPHYPLGTDFTAEEAELAMALQHLKSQGRARRTLVRSCVDGWRQPHRAEFTPLLQRLQLDRPQSLGERAMRWLVLAALAESLDRRRPLTWDEGTV